MQYTFRGDKPAKILSSLPKKRSTPGSSLKGKHAQADLSLRKAYVSGKVSLITVHIVHRGRQGVFLQQ